MNKQRGGKQIEKISLSEEEQQFLNNAKADPANKAAEAEVIQRILKILESHIS